MGPGKADKGYLAGEDPRTAPSRGDAAGRPPTVLFFGLGDMTKPSTRMRCHAIASQLEAMGIHAGVFSLKPSSKLLEGMPLKGPLMDVSFLVNAHRYDIVVFQKQCTRSSAMCMRALKALGKKVIYDIDDSIHLIERYRGNILRMAGMADAVVASSHFLEEEMRKVNPRTFRVLTPVDTELFAPTPGPRGGGPTVIGWLGTGDNARHLLGLGEVLRTMEREHGTELRVISDASVAGPTVAQLGLERARLVPWDLATVNEELGQVDVGISPLGWTASSGGRALADEREVHTTREWVLGKSAQREREYMAAGLPLVASRVGEAELCVSDGVDGFLAGDEGEWREKLGALVEDPALRARMGARARERCVTAWSVPATARLYREALESALGR